MDNSLNVIIKLTDQASQGLKTFAGNLDGMSDKIDNATQGAQTFTTVVTGVGAVVGGYAVKTFMDFEKTMSGVSAVLSPTGEEFEALSEKVKQLGADTVFSQGEIARATEELAKNGLTAAQILEGALDATANFASAAGTDLTNAGTIMSDAMNIFGIEAKNAAEAVDTLTGVTVISKFGANDLALAMSQGGGAAKAAGVSFDDFATSIAAISNGFASGSDAGTSFKTFVARLVPTTGDAAQAMREIGFNAFDASGNMKSMSEIAGMLQEGLSSLSDEQKNMALNTIFGSDALRAAAMLADTGSEKFDQLAESIGKVDAAKQAETRLDNLSGSIEKLRGTIDVMMTNLGEVLGTRLRPVIDGLNDALSNMGAWWNSLSPAMQGVIVNIGLIVGAFAGLVFIIGAIGLVAGPVITAFSTLATVFSLVVSAGGAIISGIGAVVAFLGGPVTLAILAVVAVVTGLYLAWQNNFLGIRDIVQNVSSAVINFVKGIGEGISNTWNSIQEKTTAVFSAVSQAISTVWEGIKTAVSTVLLTIIGLYILFLDQVLQLFGSNFQELVLGFSTMWENIKAGVTVFVEFVKLLFTSFFEGLRIIWTTATTAISTVWSVFSERTKGIASSMAESIKGFISGMWEGIKSFFQSGASAAGQIWGSFSSSLASTMSSAWENVKSTISSSINWIINKVNAVISAINNVSGSVGIRLNTIPPLAFQSGGIVPGFQTGGIIPGGKNPANHDQVPAMLDPGELILNRAQQSNLARQMEAQKEMGVGQTLVVQVTGNSFYGSDADFAEKVGDAIFEKFNMHTAMPSF